MTELLQEAIEKIRLLSPAEQDELATKLLQDVADMETLKSEIASGIAQLERGEYVECKGEDELRAFFEGVKEKGESQAQDPDRSAYMNRYRITDDAAEDLADIWSFIAADNEERADTLISLFYEKFLALAHAPGMGVKRDNVAPGLRLFPVREYNIYYRFITEGVEIVRVIHGKRKVENAFGLN